MKRLSQISATFIAITAGFYTTKIISIINDKSRISGRTKELEAEWNLVNRTFTILQNEIDEINAKNREDVVAASRNFFLRKIDQVSVIKNLDDLISVYRNNYDEEPSDLNLEIMKEILAELKQASKEKEEERIEEEKKRAASRNSFGFITPPPDLERVIYRSQPNYDLEIVNTLRDQNKDLYYDELIEKRDSAKNRLTILEELKKIMAQELKGVMYPKHIRFGFISFILFAFLAVIYTR